MEPEKFFKSFIQNDITFFTGVPDSLLKEFLLYVDENAKDHVCAANEGGSVALATGYHLATGKLPLVYMQNSGLGNTVNPLVSLTSPAVYSIPMVLLIGWRGEPGVSDEPQHQKQGEITPKLLETMDIPYTTLDAQSDCEKAIKVAIAYATAHNAPYALLVKKNAFTATPKKTVEEKNLLSREEALTVILKQMPKNAVIVSTTGKLSRELFEYRENNKESHEKDFLTVGSMGHASQIALGIALAQPERPVYCFDGDGAALMHLGGLALISSCKPKNFHHVIFNNNAHESVGGQETAAKDISFAKIAKSMNYVSAQSVSLEEDIVDALDVGAGPNLLEINIRKGARKDLGRPTTTPKENKEAFMRNLQ